MKILICSKLFYPDNSIGAVRPSNFAKYLAEFGHDITVIAEDIHNNQKPELDGIKTIRISNSKTIRGLISKTKEFLSTKQGIRDERCPSQSRALENNENHFITNLKYFYRSSRRQLFHLLVEFDWFIQAKKFLRSRYKNNSFDIVISSYGPIGSYRLGFFVYKSGLAVKWISDIRDHITNTDYPLWLNLIYRNFERQMERNAAAITFVSKGQAEMFRQALRNYSTGIRKLHIIYNGYEKILEPVEHVNRDKILRISYSGQLYYGLRDFSMLFKALDSLLEEKLINRNKIIFFYAGPDSIDFNIQLSHYERLKSVCKDLGYIDKNSVSDLQKGSDVLVVLTWNTKTDKGILTGKFLEYLQVFRPIISLTSGELPNGELTEMVNLLNLGVACEYINYEESYINLKKFLLTQYIQIQNGESLIFKPNIEEIKSFHYEQITRSLHNLCEILMNDT